MPCDESCPVRSEFAPELEVARAAVSRAEAAALSYFRRPLAVDAKSDQSPVTAADRECERLLVEHLGQYFPEDGLLGEEGASKPAANGRRWIIDPIDGTRDFVRGNRLWATLLALERDGEVVVGVANFPALGEMYYAAKGQGAWRNGEPISASRISRLEDAAIGVNALNRVGRTPFGAGLLRWLEPFGSVRCLGGALDAMSVAAGHADAWLEFSAKPWDLAALKIIAEEAGARFFNFGGGASIHAGNCVICAAGLEAHLREFAGAPAATGAPR